MNEHRTGGSLPGHAVRWGILGTGRAASDFASGLRFVEGAELAAVASRDRGNAERFARGLSIGRVCDGYEELVADPSIDVVYVATPNSLHKAHSILALEAGKAVLCEKPFATTGAEASEVIALARRSRLFCMEAMWMHFLPGMQKAIELVEAGAIGKPRMLTADFGVPIPLDAASGVFDAALGGGAMMDRGVYPLALAQRLFGSPETVDAMCNLTATGVDEHSSVMMKYSGGQIALLSSTLTGYSANEAVIVGTEGRLTIHEPLCRPDCLTIVMAPHSRTQAARTFGAAIKDRLRTSRWARELRRFIPGRAKKLYVPFVGNGYNYEAVEVARCIAAAETESRIWSLDHSAAVMHTMDLIRRRWAE
jgi:predicted dehydrogenase